MIWALKYVTTNLLRWGVGTGILQQPDDIDKNFADLEERTWNLENDPPEANSVVNITQGGTGGSQLTFWFANSDSIGPFTLPTATFRFLTDGWLPDTGLFANDLFVFERAGFYQVIRDHVTASAFDPAAEDTDGEIYRFLFDPFSGSAPKAIEADTNGEYIPVLLDANKYLRWDDADVCNVVIPKNVDVPFAVGAELHFRQAGAGPVQIVGDTDVTINPPRPGFDTTTAWEGANCTVKKIDTDEWDYMGPGEAVTA